MKVFLIILFSCLFSFTGVRAQDGTPAIFPGGDTAWGHYLDTAFHKETMASLMTKKDFDRFGKTQTLLYTFSIMPDGTIGLINIQGQASQAVRNEIYRVLRESPRWTPATLNGKASIYRKKQTSSFTFD
jgi:hypothetical protein